jgi:hypothetical protein
MESSSSSESEVDIPIFFPVPFQELSSVQYFSLEEQLIELTAALKNQFQRHCFIQIRQQETQPMLVPFVEPVSTFTYSRTNLDLYIDRQHQKQNALSADEVDLLLKEQDLALLQIIGDASPPEESPAEELPNSDVRQLEPTAAKPRVPIWERTGAPKTGKQPLATSRKPGPKADAENHAKVAKIIRSYGDSWTTDENLIEICQALDREEVPIPKPWPQRDPPSRSWKRALTNYPGIVIKAIKDRLKAA